MNFATPVNFAKEENLEVLNGFLRKGSLLKSEVSRIKNRPLAWQGICL